MELSNVEVAVLEAFSAYIVDGKVSPDLTVGMLIEETGLPPELVNGALSRLLGRDWVIAPTKYNWELHDPILLRGHGLAVAIAIAAGEEHPSSEVDLAGK